MKKPSKKGKRAEPCSDEGKFLDHLFEQPDDTEKWVEFGAWLREQGDVRGDLIALDEAWRATDASDIESRQAALQKVMDVEEAAYSADDQTDLRWCRGHVVEGWFFSQKSLKTLLATPFGRCLQRVANGKKVKGKQAAGWLKALGGAPIRILHLRGELGVEGAEALAKSEHLDGLRSLNLAGAKIGPEGMQVLAQAKHLGSLEALYLGGNALGDEGARAFAEAGHLSSLRYLQLAGNDIGPEGAEALSGASHLSGLTFLNLGYNRLESAGAQALANATHLASLIHLRLPGNAIGADGAEALAQAQHLATLVDLRLDNNAIETSGAEALAQSPHLKSLNALTLAFNGVDDSCTAINEHAERIQECSGLPSAAGSQAFNKTTFLEPIRSFSQLPGHWPPDYWTTWGKDHGGMIIGDHWPFERGEPKTELIRRKDLLFAMGSGPSVSEPCETIEEAAQR